METDRRVLVVDDDPSVCELLQAELGRRHFQVVSATTPEKALRLLADEELNLLVTDIRLDGISGLELCRAARAMRGDIPVVLMTAHASLELAIAAIRAGAYDFVTKPLSIDDLARTMDRALRNRDLRKHVKRLRKAVEDPTFGELIGQSAAMKSIADEIAHVADTASTVLVTGESGTGKGLVAKALHAKSNRHQRPFVAIDCTAISATLLEGELFGHAKGAGTDARDSRPGLLMNASGGTLFVDEIGEMPLPLQSKLLRALQARAVRPAGAGPESPADICVVAATSRDLAAEVRAGRFRADLFYLLSAVHLSLPPLRERENDVLLLAQHFLVRSRSAAAPRIVGFTSAAANRLSTYSWPRNVRELRSCLERAVGLTRFDHVGIDDLPERVREAKASPVPTDDGTRFPSIAEVEHRYTLQVLEVAKGNKTLAARVLGIDRRTLYRNLHWGWMPKHARP